MIFYHGFDREMLNSIGFYQFDKRSIQMIEAAIEAELKILVFIMPLDEQIAISPSFRFESMVCRKTLEKNREFVDQGLIVECRNETDLKDFWLKKSYRYHHVMDISKDYKRAYGEEKIYKDISKMYIRSVPKQKPTGMVSRDSFIDNLIIAGKLNSIPDVTIQEIIKITKGTENSTFLWEVEQDELIKRGIPYEIIHGLNIRKLMNESYLDAFATQKMSIYQSTVRFVDKNDYSKIYKIPVIRAILEREGIFDIITSINAQSIISLRKHLELQDAIAIIRSCLSKNLSLENTHSLIKAKYNLASLVAKILIQPFGGNKMSNENYGVINNSTIKLLHISDLHLTDIDSASKHLFHLKLDLCKSLKIKTINYLIVTGDVCNLPKEEMYKVAEDFIRSLATEFNIDNNHIILVPGNHDCDRDVSKEAYDSEEKKIEDLSKYNNRYKKFSDFFYQPIKGKPYPMEPELQFEDFVFDDDGLCFLALNSSCTVDHLSTHSSSICMEAIQKSKSIWSENDKYTKIAVWHHPLSGYAPIQDTTFMDTLAASGFKMCMHGHIHEAKNSVFSYDDSHKVRIVGAGTLGALKEDRGAGIPLQYNILEYYKEEKLFCVHTRKREKEDGIWEADARWGDKTNLPKSYYIIK